MEWPFVRKANGSLPYEIRGGHLYELVLDLLQEVPLPGLWKAVRDRVIYE